MKSSHRFSPSAIGMFVIGAIFLLIVGLFSLGKGSLFETRVQYHILFTKSVKGLSIGSPVTFRGIRIGEVSEIRVALPMEDLTQRDSDTWPILVTIDIIPQCLLPKSLDPNIRAQITQMVGTINDDEKVKQWIHRMVLEKGLRAQLESQSLLTGMLYISLDLYASEKNTPAIQKELEQYAIIPTRVSPFEKLMASLSTQDLTSPIEKVLVSLDNINNCLQSEKTWNMMDDFAKTARNTEEATSHISAMLGQFRSIKQGDRELPPAEIFGQLTTSYQKLLDQLNETVTQMDKKLPELLKEISDSVILIKQTTQTLAPKLTSAVDETSELMVTAKKTLECQEGPSALLVQDLQKTLQDIQGTLGIAKKALNQMEQTLDPRSSAQADISKTLQDIRDTAQSLRALSDLLNQQPNALIKGK